MDWALELSNNLQVMDSGTSVQNPTEQVGMIQRVIDNMIPRLKDQIPTCGEEADGSDDKDLIDLREPQTPGPFHDLTAVEMEEVLTFLERDPNIRAVRGENATIKSSFIQMVDLHMAKKSEVLRYLDENGTQPIRQARVIMLRGDLETPQVEEYVCGPLPNINSCSLMKSKKRRNPVEFTLRPFNLIEFGVLLGQVTANIHKQIRHILNESFGCSDDECFKYNPSPINTNLINDTGKRLYWVHATFAIDYYSLHPTGLGFLIDMSRLELENMAVLKVWYNNQMFQGLTDFITQYDNNSLQKMRMLLQNRDKLYSSSKPRENLLPETPKRAPTLVEPDGKRYTLKERKVEYLGWTFNFRLSAALGPSVFDIRYKNERIAYELGVAEIAVFYSANNAIHSTTDYVDSAGFPIGTFPKGLVPGADCPDTATFINVTSLNQRPNEYDRALCLFENNNGFPLRRHQSYSSFEGGFYGGLMDSVLVLRTLITVANYDYVLDYIFHQNGVVETKIMSTGYIVSSLFSPAEKAYGFQIENNTLGCIHQHLFHFKADLDIGGTSNRYETLDISSERVDLNIMNLNRTYNKLRIDPRLKRTEKEALYKFDFNSPKYHVVHNNAKKTKFDEIKAYRIIMNGMSKQILPEGEGNENIVSWARHQLVATKHKDDEVFSSSPYCMFDSANPVVDFSQFYDDDEDIVDEDLVFWISQGLHHLPHTEDLPLTSTIGKHLSFLIYPFNYFDECPSMKSRDQIYVGYKNITNPKEGLEVNRNQNLDNQCLIPQTATAYDNLLKATPDVAIESRN